MCQFLYIILSFLLFLISVIISYYYLISWIWVISGYWIKVLVACWRYWINLRGCIYATAILFFFSSSSPFSYSLCILWYYIFWNGEGVKSDRLEALELLFVIFSIHHLDRQVSSFPCLYFLFSIIREHRNVPLYIRYSSACFFPSSFLLYILFVVKNKKT